ncbi:uncharacterized protein [Ambystoma mexicanum]|uniref:uncharacterized protein isoform X1 n=1 Tax=Ambystoma mexicanum TaxID=8296 RepID=UPI0037E76975
MSLNVDTASTSNGLQQELGIHQHNFEMMEHKPRSKFVPAITDATVIDTFYQAVIQDIHKQIDRSQFQSTKSNLTLSEKTALKNLAEDTSIVIKEADKGGNIVILNTADYITMANEHLSTPGCYQLLPGNPTKETVSELKVLLYDCHSRGTLTDEEKAFLYRPNPVIPTMYFLPKIHKAYTTLPQVRPIMSGLGWATEGLSQYIDSAIKDMVPALPAYLRDSTQTLEILHQLKWCPNYLLATFDVKALYTSIQHRLALQTIDYTFRNHSASHSQHVYMIKDFLHFTLAHNQFLFNNQYHLQTKGVAMGATYAPSLANLFMGFFEDKHIYTDHPYKQNLIVWRRYIDDVLVIWNGTSSSFVGFSEYLNRNNFGIEFSGHVSSQSMEFLDLQINIVNGELQTQTFRKPTTVNAMLHASSCHKKSVISNIPFGEFYRARRNCSTDMAFQHECRMIRRRFYERGYSSQCIKQGFNRINTFTQDQTLVTNTESTRPSLEYVVHNEIFRRPLYALSPVKQTLAFVET